MYGRDNPPEYNLTQISATINLFFSKDDDTTVYENVIKLKTQLPNVKSSYVIPFAEFTHLDFTYSRFVRKVLNDPLIKTINNANRNN